MVDTRHSATARNEPGPPQSPAPSRQNHSVPVVDANSNAANTAGTAPESLQTSISSLCSTFDQIKLDLAALLQHFDAEKKFHKQHDSDLAAARQDIMGLRSHILEATATSKASIQVLSEDKATHSD